MPDGTPEACAFTMSGAKTAMHIRVERECVKNEPFLIVAEYSFSLKQSTVTRHGKLILTYRF
jgi:hypothetical protein